MMREPHLSGTILIVCTGIVLMIVGGINWGLVGLFQFDFVGWLLGGSASIWSRIVFTAVGLAALCGIPGAVHRGNRGITERLLHNSVQQPFYSVQMCKSLKKQP